jgi:hypothetical protein
VRYKIFFEEQHADYKYEQAIQVMQKRISYYEKYNEIKMSNTVKIKYEFEKEDLVYWISIFTFVSIYVLVSYLSNKNYHVILLIIIELIVPFVFLSYLFTNLFQCKKFCRLCNTMKQNGMEITVNKCYIKTKIKDYRIKIIRAGDVPVKTYFRSIKSHSVQTNDFLILFFQIRDFGMFSRYIRPLVFMKNNTKVPNFMKNIYLIDAYEKKQIENDTCIKFNKKLDDIEYLVLPAELEI